MYYIIFRDNQQVARVKPDDSSTLTQQKQTKDVVYLNFKLENYIEFKIGDYIVFEKTQQKYFLNKRPTAIESPQNYNYACIFEGGLHELEKTKVQLTTPKTTGGNYLDYSFPLTGNAQTFLSFIVENLNRTGSGWTAGIYEETSTVNIDFNNWNCFEAISEISDQLGFDWYLEGKQINFKSRDYKNPYVFQVGRRSGFTKLTRTRVESENIHTVVYGYGSTENMPPRTGDGTTYDSNLLTENRLCFIGDDGDSKLSKNVDKFGIRESVQIFEDIKPEFTGEVDSVIDNNNFIDSSIDFDINDQLLSGITPKVSFISGKLLGLTFDIDFDNVTKKITLGDYTDESGTYPNDIIFAEAGDTYKIFDIVMPDSYVLDAATRLEEATQSYIDKQSDNLESYSGVLDEYYIQRLGIELFIGDLLRVISAPFAIDTYYEIKELVQNITEPYKYAIKFGEVSSKNLLTLLKEQNFKTSNKITNVQNSSVTNNQVTNIVGDTSEWE